MKYIGPHVSTEGGVQNAPLNAALLGATGFGMFTKNQRQWTALAYTTETIAAFKKNCSENSYAARQILPHDTYLINLGSPDPAAFARSYAAFTDELRRCAALGLTMLNIHPGSHLKLLSEEQCLLQIAGAINRAHRETEGVCVVLETTAGQGSNVGYRFEHLAFVIKNVRDKSRVGVCLDTCHIFGAGYDIRTEKTYEATMREFDRVIGFSFLRAAHVNDAKVELGSRVDRHQSIGKGTLGLTTFRLLMADERFEEIPLVLETIDESLWNGEVALLKQMTR